MILITGASGLLGSHLTLQLLEMGEPVRAIYRTATAIQKTKSVFELHQKIELFSKIEWIQADITDVPSLETAFQNIDRVYHCAALISFNPADEKALRKTNIEGTANIVNFCLAYGVKKLCYVSSIAALGDLKEGETLVTETTEWNPEFAHSDYAISKYGAEMEVWRGWQEGLEVAIVNPGVILGAVPNTKDWQSGSTEIFSRVRKGLSFYTQGSTGFVTVDDVVKLLVQLMQSSISGERFIAVSENYSYEKLLQMVAYSMQIKPPSYCARPWLTSVYWRIDWLLSLLGRKRSLSQIMARSLHQSHRFSNDKAIAELGFRFEPVADAIEKIGAAQV
jgi:dihydroflavonol-4-reductase